MTPDKLKTMQQSYSQNLINQCKKVMQKKTGKKISNDEAEIILDQFARLGTVAIKSFKKDEKASKHFDNNH